MGNLVIGSDVMMRYCQVTVKTDFGGIETLCIRSIKNIPSNDELLLFLNYVWSHNYYTEIIEIKEISATEADNYDTSDDVFVNNFFEIEADDGDELVNTFCITGINEPTPQDALECINYSRADCEKMKNVHWCRRIDMNKAISNYQMNGWMWPWDIEMI